MEAGRGPGEESEAGPMIIGRRAMHIARATFPSRARAEPWRTSGGAAGMRRAQGGGEVGGREREREWRRGAGRGEREKEKDIDSGNFEQNEFASRSDNMVCTKQ